MIINIKLDGAKMAPMIHLRLLEFLYFSLGLILANEVSKKL